MEGKKSSLVPVQMTMTVSGQIQNQNQRFKAEKNCFNNQIVSNFKDDKMEAKSINHLAH